MWLRSCPYSGSSGSRDPAVAPTGIESPACPPSPKPVGEQMVSGREGSLLGTWKMLETWPELDFDVDTAGEAWGWWGEGGCLLEGKVWLSLWGGRARRVLSPHCLLHLDAVPSRKHTCPSQAQACIWLRRATVRPVPDRRPRMRHVPMAALIPACPPCTREACEARSQGPDSSSGPIGCSPSSFCPLPWPTLLPVTEMSPLLGPHRHRPGKALPHLGVTEGTGNRDVFRPSV